MQNVIRTRISDEFNKKDLIDVYAFNDEIREICANKRMDSIDIEHLFDNFQKPH